MKRKYNKSIFLFLIIVIFVCVGAYSLLSIINTEEFVESNILRVQGNTIIVGRDCKAIVADTSDERAESIESGMTDTIIGRPNTHDIFFETLKFFNITLDSIQIVRFDGQNYYADIILTDGNKVFRLDSRPSDAIALAVRTNSTVFINKILLSTFGQDICV